MSHLANRSVHPLLEHYPQSGRLMNFNPQPGMTLRHWFAGQALAGTPSRDLDPSETARKCVAIADALLAELEKPSA